MQEQFKSLRSWDQGLKKHRQYQVIECSRCQTFVNMPITKDRALPPEAVVQMMSKKGWVMGHRRKDDICPECVGRSRKPALLKIADYLPETAAAPREEPTEETTAMGSISSISAPASLVQTPMTSREAKRVVLFEIEKRYDDSARCYRGDWTDQKIAESLSVSVDLVTNLREEFYGPTIDPELITLRTDVEALRAMVTTIQNKIEELQSRINSKFKEE